MTLRVPGLDGHPAHPPLGNLYLAVQTLRCSQTRLKSSTSRLRKMLQKKKNKVRLHFFGKPGINKEMLCNFYLYPPCSLSAGRQELLRRDLMSSLGLLTFPSWWEPACAQVRQHRIRLWVGGRGRWTDSLPWCSLIPLSLRDPTPPCPDFFLSPFFLSFSFFLQSMSFLVSHTYSWFLELSPEAECFSPAEPPLGSSWTAGDLLLLRCIFPAFPSPSWFYYQPLHHRDLS